MATSNLELTPEDDWTMIVPTSATWALVSVLGSAIVSVATTSSNSTGPGETIVGHPFSNGQQISRSAFGGGAIWMKVMPNVGGALLVINYG